MKYLEKPRKLTKKNFEKWLRSFAPNKVVGITCIPELCPVANFLGVKNVSVGSDDYSVNNSICKPTPKWTAKFIYNLDSSVGFDTKVTAAKALKILAEIV